MAEALKIRPLRGMRIGEIGLRFLLFIAAIEANGMAQTAAQIDRPPTRNTMELSAAVNAALRAELQAKGNEAEQATVQSLADLHTELTRHPRFASSKLLQRHIRRINVRMLRIFDRLTEGAADADGEPPNTGVSRFEREDNPESIEETTAVLAQRLPQQGVGGRAAPNRNANVNGANGAAGGGVSDHSAALIDIIASTITPDTWDRVGGPSSLLYYSQGMALVVRAPQEVHDDMRDLLLQLRAAGP